MNRMLVADTALPKPSLPKGEVLTALAAGTLGAGYGLVVDSPFITVCSAGTAVAGTAAIVALHMRHRRRLETLDLYLLRLTPMLGWPHPDRDQIKASRWTGGWVGHPTRIRIRFNPIADEEAGAIIAEARRLAHRAFGGMYKLDKVDQRRGRIFLVRAGDVNEQTQEERLERVNTLISKSFGAGSKMSAKLDDDGSVREITVTYEVTPRLASSALRARLESSVSAMLPGRWRAFWDLQHDTVRLEVRPQLDDVIPNPNIAPAAADVDPLKTYDGLKVPYAMDEDGATIYWKPKDDPHGLITGKTGKGKTVCILGIVQYLAAHGWEIWGIDGKRIELLGLREWPNVKLIAGRIDHQARVAHEIYTLMQKRFEDYENGLVRLEDFTPVLFVVDEFKTFKNAVNRWFRSVKPKGPGSQAPVLEEISDFVSLARKVRMHLLIGLQRPDAEFLTGDMRDNFNFRVSFGRLSPEGAKMMWDSFSTGVAIPIKAKGRGIAYNAQGTPVEVQSFWTPDPYQTQLDKPETWVFPGDDRLVRNLTPSKRLHELMAIIDPEPETDFEKGETRDPDYLDYMAAPVVPAGRIHEHTRLAAGLFKRAEQPAQSDATSRVAVLERIQKDAEEPEIDDEQELFAGYSPAHDAAVEELLDDHGELAQEGALILVDPDNDSWGLVEFAELDIEDEGYINLSYRDYLTGEPGSYSIPADDAVTVRLPN